MSTEMPRPAGKSDTWLHVRCAHWASANKEQLAAGQEHCSGMQRRVEIVETHVDGVEGSVWQARTEGTEVGVACGGAVMSIDFWRVSGAELAHPHPGGVPAAALWLIRALNLVFNGLNALWFSKMLRGAIKARPAVGAIPLTGASRKQCDRGFTPAAHPALLVADNRFAQKSAL